jgi:general secretion pathway protein J
MSLRSDDAATAGFTLLEALIAMALMGTILATLGVLTSQWLPNWNRGVALVQGDDQIALGLERLLADVASAEFVPRRHDRRGPLFDGTGKSVRFVRTALGPNAGQNLEMVRIAEIESEYGPILVRMRGTFADRIADTNLVEWTDPVVLLRPPYRITISYAGPDRVWRDEWLHQPQLPRAIRVSARDTARPRNAVVSGATLVHTEVPVECLAAKSLADCWASYLRPAESADRPRS